MLYFDLFCLSSGVVGFPFLLGKNRPPKTHTHTHTSLSRVRVKSKLLLYVQHFLAPLGHPLDRPRCDDSSVHRMRSLHAPNVLEVLIPGLRGCRNIMAGLCRHEAVEEGAGLTSQPMVVRIMNKWKWSGPIVKESSRRGVVERGFGCTRAL